MDFYTFCPEGYDYPASESVCASIADDYGYSYEGAEGPYGTGHPPCFHAFEGGSNGMAWVYGYSSSECSDMSGDWDDLGAVCVRVGGPYDTMGCTESSTGACASASTSVSTTCPIYEREAAGIEQASWRGRAGDPCARARGRHVNRARAGGGARFCRVVRDKYESYCLLYTSPSPRDRTRSRMPSSA